MTLQESVRSALGVSVVIATRARPELLRSAIRAVMQQRYSAEIETVVVFDQTPTDDTLSDDVELEGHYGPRTIRVIENTRTPGLAGARNTGVLRSSQPLLAFCDDDDCWYAPKLGRQVEAMRQERRPLSVCGIEIEINGRTRVRVPRTVDVRVETLARRRVMEAHPSTVVVRRDAFHAIGLVDENLPGSYAEDYDWMLRALQHSPAAVVSEPLVRVLWHPGSFFNTRWETIIDALDYMVDKHAVIRCSPPGLARIYGQKAFAYAALGRRAQARKWAWRALRLQPTERRAYLALAVSARALSAPAVVTAANSRGRGI